MKYCPNCGKEIVEGAAFCDNCGTKLESVEKNNNGVKRENPYADYLPENRFPSMNTNGGSQNSYTNNRGTLPNRSIPLAIIFSLITCGLYSLYWFIVMTDEANSISDEPTTNGALSLILTLVTCGLYGIYWNYQMGKKLYTAGVKNNIAINDNSIIYLILSLFGLGIVNYCLIQNDLNKFSV